MAPQGLCSLVDMVPPVEGAPPGPHHCRGAGKQGPQASFCFPATDCPAVSWRQDGLAGQSLLLGPRSAQGPAVPGRSARVQGREGGPFWLFRDLQRTGPCLEGPAGAPSTVFSLRPIPKVTL